MKYACPIFVAAALCISVNAQTVTQIDVFEGEGEEGVGVQGPPGGGPAIGSQFSTGWCESISMGTAWWNYYPPSHLPLGVTVQEMRLSGTLEVNATAEFTGLAPGGTYLEVWGPAYGSAAWIYGPGSWDVVPPCTGTLTVSANIPEGVQVSVPWTLCAHQWNETITPGHHAWSIIENGGFLLQAGHSGMSAHATTGLGGPPVDIQCDSLVARIAGSVRLEVTYELAPVATTVYCTSPANGTGQHGGLEAYGAPSQSSEWLTVRATNVPEGAYAIMFVGTAETSIPGATTTTCIAGYVQRVGGIQLVQNGVADFEVNLYGWLPGDVAHFQAFHRDPVLGVAATDAVSMDVQ